MDVVGWSGLTWSLRYYGRGVVTYLDLFHPAYERIRTWYSDMLWPGSSGITDVVF